MDDIYELREECQESQKILSQLDQLISNIKLGVKYENKEAFQKINDLLEEKTKLTKTHENNLKVIEKHKFQIQELENMLVFQKSKIENIKAEIGKKSLKKIPEPPKKNKIIENIKDIRESFGFFLKENMENNKNEKIIKAPCDEDKIEFEK